MEYSSIKPKLLQEQIHEHWSPRIIAQMNDYHIKIAKVLEEFVWHSHADTDEAFFVLEGQLTIEMRDGSVSINPGELFVVPKGVEHRPAAEDECLIMLIEPAGTINTGDEGGERTLEAQWLYP